MEYLGSVLNKNMTTFHERALFPTSVHNTPSLTLNLSICDEKIYHKYVYF